MRILFQAERYKDVEGTNLQRFDNERIIISLLSMGLKHVRIEAEERQISFLFVKPEIDEFINKILSGEPIQVELAKVFEAYETWKAALLMMKIKRQEN